MSIYKQRDIVLVPFPFSDLSGLKVRPVLILSVAGTLRHTSRAKADTIASLEQSILIKQIARLQLAIFNQVIAQIQMLFRS